MAWHRDYRKHFTPRQATAPFIGLVYSSMLRLCLKKMTVIGCPTHEAFPGCVMTTGGNFLYVQYMFLPFKIKERSSPGFHSRSSLGSITQITNSCINSLLRFPCHENRKFENFRFFAPPIGSQSQINSSLGATVWEEFAKVRKNDPKWPHFRPVTFDLLTYDLAPLGVTRYTQDT